MRQRRSFWHNQRGGVLIMTAASALILVVVAGAAIDFGRWALVRLRAQQASDAAAIAVAVMPGNPSKAQRDVVMRRYFMLNFGETYIGTTIAPSQVQGDFTNNVTVWADTAAMPTVFLQLIAIDTLPVTPRSVLPKNTTSTLYDILLVMDNSQSMADADVGSVNAPDAPSTSTLLNNAIAYCRANLPYLETFPQECNLNRFSRPPGSEDFMTTGLEGPSRLNALRFAANTFATNLLTNNPGSLVGAVSWSTGVIASLSPTGNLSTVQNFLNTMYAWGATNSFEGFKQAQSLASGLNPSHVPVIIYITDGFNTVADVESYKYYPSTNEVRDDWSCTGGTYCPKTNELTLPICESFKSNGTQIYAIAFGDDINKADANAASARAFMQACASKDKDGNAQFFIAPDAQTLSDQFNAILKSVYTIKLVE